MQEAEELLNTTAKPHSSRRRRREKEGRTEAIADIANGALPASVGAALSKAEAEATAAGAIPPFAEGGWNEDMEVEDAGDLDHAAAKFKPGIKFKLAS